MVVPTPKQKEILATDGNLLVTGGPGSGKTTISIIKAGQITEAHLKPGQKILFLSFARATVSRVLEAIDEEDALTPAARKRIEVDTYHSFFWQILKTHGYLLGYPRRLSLLTPPNEGIALAPIRFTYKADGKLSEAEKTEKQAKEEAELQRLAVEEGRVCFDVFAPSVGKLLHASDKIRKLMSNAYPVIILDEFQDTNGDQWHVVKALGKHSTLIALADPEQRIYDFIGADPERLNHFRAEFKPTEFDLAGENHRSKGTDIALFGNELLTGKFTKDAYDGVDFEQYEYYPNHHQPMVTLVTQTLGARKRLLKAGKKDWSLAILVKTRLMVRMVSDAYRSPFGNVPPITHTAVVDMAGPILGAELIALLLQPAIDDTHLASFIEGLCNFFRGKGGKGSDTPTKGGMEEADKIQKAHQTCLAAQAKGKQFPKTSIFVAIKAVYDQVCAIKFTGDPDEDWRAVCQILAQGSCPRLKELAEEVKNIRLLDRGTQLRQALTQDWRGNGAYINALDIVRLAFVQEHFSSAHKPETGIVVMNMHKAKGKQFDEVIIFEGWPVKQKGKIVSNNHRIVWSNERTDDMSQDRQNFRVSVTRARKRTTILMPKGDPCVLLLSEA